MLQPFPVIVGPTAGGKSAVAVELAGLLAASGRGNAEIVTADSMQVYRGMDIGTAKPTPAERRGIPHHLIDLVDPGEAFSVDRWLHLAESCIADVRDRGATPIVVGGTMLYIKALLEGLFDGPASDPALRAELQTMDPRRRRLELERLDPQAASRIHPNDARRTIRALEVFRLTGTPISQRQQQWDAGFRRPDAFLVVLEWPTADLNRRINARVKAMMDAGLEAEARALWIAGKFNTEGGSGREALGYKQLIAHFEGRTSLEDAVERIKIETRRFAKNQRTWLRRLAAQPGTLRVPMLGSSAVEAAQIVADQMFTRHGRGQALKP